MKMTQEEARAILAQAAVSGRSQPMLYDQLAKQMLEAKSRCKVLQQEVDQLQRIIASTIDVISDARKRSGDISVVNILDKGIHDKNVKLLHERPCEDCRFYRTSTRVSDESCVLKRQWVPGKRCGMNCWTRTQPEGDVAVDAWDD